MVASAPIIANGELDERKAHASGRLKQAQNAIDQIWKHNGADRYFVGSISAVKPMPRRFGAGGFMSSRIAERMAVIASSWPLSFRSRSFSLPSQLGVGGEQLAQLHERAHDVEAHLDGTRAVQDRGGHDGAVFGEANVGSADRGASGNRSQTVTGSAPRLRCVSDGTESPPETARRRVYGLVQGFGRDAIERGQLGVEDDALRHAGAVSPW